MIVFRNIRLSLLYCQLELKTKFCGTMFYPHSVVMSYGNQVKAKVRALLLYLKADQDIFTAHTICLQIHHGKTADYLGF